MLHVLGCCLSYNLQEHQCIYTNKIYKCITIKPESLWSNIIIMLSDSSPAGKEEHPRH